ncbi:MAG: HAMP domain-containing histidine kinase, partial [Anaerolinea sp.]|nr:HAMP domain-containing histidine kinase [Anaerolinea sp.]
QLDKMKSDFIAIASHELRTPLGVILGYASFLQESTDEDVRALAGKVVNSALQLRRIIEDLTNLRYLEEKATDLDIEKVVLRDFLQSAIHDVRELAEAKRHTLVFNEPPPHLRVAIDVIRMGMAVTNVLNNALRFTPDGGTITIDSEVRGQQVAVMVHDNGVGIAREDLERIFERFVQVEDHMTRTTGGMGIGLSIARALVEAHGGKIWASSPGLNQGSTFTITMPLVGKNAESGAARSAGTSATR